MSRLIEADTPIHVQMYDDMTEEWSLKETTVAEALDDWSDEGCPPTVEAIPIKWLTAQADNPSNSDKLRNAIDYIVYTLWAERKEENE